VKLTEKAVAKLVAGKKRVQHYDAETPGFGVRVDPNGRKSYFWYAKVNGNVRFRALGEFLSVSVQQARTDAKELVGIAAEWKRLRYEGEDPFEKKERIVPASAPTFKELTEAYIEQQVRANASHPEKAEADLRGRLRTHFTTWMDRQIDSLTVEDVLALKNKCGKYRLAANRCVELVRRLFNWSARSRNGKINYWRVENPAKDVELYEEKSRDVFLQPEQMIRFNKCLDNETHVDLKDFLILSMTTGARKADIFSMRWQDWHRERKIWTVPYPKNAESYDVELLPSTIAVLERRRAEAPDSAVYVFPGAGKTGHLMELRKPWMAFRKRAGIPEIHVHDLRRTVGSYLAISGTPLQQIAAALGHKSMQSTLVYARLQNEAIRDARESGQAKMLELMNAAKKRLKIAGKKQKALTAGA